MMLIESPWPEIGRQVLKLDLAKWFLRAVDRAPPGCVFCRIFPRREPGLGSAKAHLPGEFGWGDVRRLVRDRLKSATG